MACWAASHGVCCCCRTPKSRKRPKASRRKNLCLVWTLKMYKPEVGLYISMWRNTRHPSVKIAKKKKLHLYMVFFANKSLHWSHFFHPSETTLIDWLQHMPRRAGSLTKVGPFFASRKKTCEPKKNLPTQEFRSLNGFRPPSSRNPMKSFIFIWVFFLLAGYYKAYVEFGHTFILALKKWWWW